MAAAGLVFQLAPNQDGSWTETVLHSFCFVITCHDASGPTASLIFDQTGNLYGTTLGGYPSDRSAVFELTPNADGSWKERVLHNFGQTSEGRWDSLCGCDLRPGRKSLRHDAPSGRPSRCPETGGCGVAYKLAPSPSGGWKETVLREFTGRDGLNPAAGLIFDQAGNLYGATEHGGDLSFCGGSNGCGIIFKLTPTSKRRMEGDSVAHLLRQSGSFSCRYSDIRRRGKPLWDNRGRWQDDLRFGV